MEGVGIEPIASSPRHIESSLMHMDEQTGQVYPSITELCPVPVYQPDRLPS